MKIMLIVFFRGHATPTLKPGKPKQPAPAGRQSGSQRVTQPSGFHTARYSSVGQVLVNESECHQVSNGEIEMVPFSGSFSKIRLRMYQRRVFFKPKDD